jgi:hypothetical protein
VFGNENTSHGRIGLHDAKGASDSSVAGYAFYASSMLGDVAIVENSGEKTVDPANGLNGWTCPGRSGRPAARFSRFAPIHGVNSPAARALSLFHLLTAGGAESTLGPL